MIQIILSGLCNDVTYLGPFYSVYSEDWNILPRNCPFSYVHSFNQTPFHCLNPTLCNQNSIGLYLDLNRLSVTSLVLIPERRPET